ncbi:hypothetical protein BDV25DRAFT_171631 [Aspergillus avenaceus]|uniref:Uncharacterized protein n=1 Tax=Aspergillus avenaceus TaxID=36643 RepID=A0A5N6TXZ7_ASPAV|nr:hypothetical protein BDV25DRAFT_171631 [Aspergillus avenaceus]
MLTPIRVRGRRKKPPAALALTKRPPGRRLNRITEARRSRKRSKRAKLHHEPTPPAKRRTLSRLEALPVELIEKIFLASVNVNLPRASTVLAATVSSERIYRALVLLAFWNDDLVGGCSGEVARLLRPLDYVPLGLEARARLQGEIFRCKWCTVARVLGRLPEMMGLSVRRHWFDAGVVMVSGEEERLNRFLAREESEHGNGHTFTGTVNDTIHTLTISPPISITITDTATDSAQTHRILRITEFPVQLLTRPSFTPETTTYLEFLRLASGLNTSTLQETSVSISRDALQKGIRTALHTRNKDALATLLKLDEYYFRAQNTAITATQSPVYGLPAEHFRVAVRADDPGLFQLLVRASAESVPDDSEITAWAMELDSGLGRWVLDLLLHLPQRVEAARANPVEGAVFYMGRANAQVELARQYLSEVLGVEELGSWMEESSLDVRRLWRDV